MTKEKFNAYRKVQFSGATNMWAINEVMRRSGLEEEECMDIMKNYSKYEKEFGKFEALIGEHFKEV